MDITTKFGKYISETEIEFAPTTFADDKGLILCPSVETYAEHGYKPVEDIAPVTDGGQYAVAIKWKDTDDKIVRVYEVREKVVEKKIRIFSKLKAYMELTEMGVWPIVEEELKASGMWTAFILANEVKEDNPMFMQGLQSMKEILDLDDEAVYNFLKKIEMD